MQSGTLVRLIDVVLILLFGFISISEVTYRSHIELPKSEQTPPSYPDEENILFIGILPDGTYLVEDEEMAIIDIQVLYKYLKNKKIFFASQGVQLRVRIRSAWNTPIKYMMTVSDICDNLEISKGFDVEKKAD